jgi:hypothetical protein
MSKLFECEIEYVPNSHLMQIYTGFFELEKLGVIDLKLKKIKHTSSFIPIINAVIDKKYKVVYDTIDGLSWIPGDESTNLVYFQNSFKTDFYFKRSFDSRMLEYKPENCEVYPLGLNYNVQPDKNMFWYNDTLQDKLKYLTKTSKLLKGLSHKKFFYTKDFEYYPVKQNQNRILFITRLWSPEDARSDRSKVARSELNTMRLECIESGKKAYGDLFTGGLFIEPYAKKNYPSLLMPASLTSKAGFLQTVKEHTICITTTGLHKSIGWKLAEYVAASRAIVTEPLNFKLPGNFTSGRNYYEFESPKQLLTQVNSLLSNPGQIVEIMKNNYYYYNNFVKPERLVLNTLLTVANNCKKKNS